MSAFTDFTEQALRDLYKAGSAISATSTYVGLATSDPGETGSTAGEPTGAWYSRQQIHTTGNASTPEWQNASTGTGIENASAVTFPSATTTPASPISHAFIVDGTTGATGTNIRLKTSLTSSKTIASGDQAKFNAGSLDFTFD